MRRYYSESEGYVESSDWKHASWMSVEIPDDDDRHFLTGKLHMPAIFLDYLGDPDERPRVEREGNWTLTILLIPVEAETASDMPFKTVPFGIVSDGGKRLMTICCFNNIIVSDFVDISRKRGINADNTADFTLQVFSTTAEWYLRFLKTLTNDVVGVEKDLKKTIRNDDLIRLMRIQKSLVFFNTSIKGDLMVLEKIEMIYEKDLDKDLLEDVEIEFRQADSTVGIYSDILENTLDTYASIISNNVNGVMKRMSGLSIILMVPTFVASLYGMNVDILLGGTRYAFWIIILIAIVLTAVAFVCLRRIRWI